MNSTSALLLCALCVLLMVTCGLSKATNCSKPTNCIKSQPETYFGVEASDKAAVLAKMKELAMEQWQKMMGPLQDIEEMDFSPDMSGGVLEIFLDGLGRFLKKNENIKSQQ